MDLDDIQKHIDEAINEMNSRSVNEFEGLSPRQMLYLINIPFDKYCPVQFKPLTEAEYKQIPIMKQMLFVTQLLQEAREIKLTQTGALPTKIVSELCGREFLMDEGLNYSSRKNFRESDSLSVQLTRFLLDLTGIAKKRNNRLSLTKNGEKLISKPESLFRIILEKYTTRFNWAYFDGYGDHQVGQLGFLFSVYLVSKYGDKKREDIYYAEKYMNAYPSLINEIKPRPYSNISDMFYNSYSLRTFDRFMKYFGLVEVEHEKWGEPTYVWKTDLLDRIVSINI